MHFNSRGATQVWLTSSEFGRDLTPRIAARQGVGALSDVTKLELNGDEITAYRPCMATKAIQKCKFNKDGLRVISMQPGSIPLMDHLLLLQTQFHSLSPLVILS